MARNPFIDDLLADVSKKEPKDDSGLDATQRRFLRARHWTLSDRAALDEIGASFADILRWQDDDSFNQAYAALKPRATIEQVKAGIDALAPEALNLMAKALNGDELNKSQRWVVDKLLKVIGLEKIFIESTHTVFPYEARLALALLERGKAIPPAMYDLALQFFPDQVAALAAPVIEGEVHVIEEEKEPSAGQEE